MAYGGRKGRRNNERSIDRSNFGYQLRRYSHNINGIFLVHLSQVLELTLRKQRPSHTHCTIWPVPRSLLSSYGKKLMSSLESMVGRRVALIKWKRLTVFSENHRDLNPCRMVSTENNIRAIYFLSYSTICSGSRTRGPARSYVLWWDIRAERDDSAHKYPQPAFR